MRSSSATCRCRSSGAHSTLLSSQLLLLAVYEQYKHITRVITDRSFTTLLGDFDVAALYERGWGSIGVFTTAALFGNVVMLNLLIAIVRFPGPSYIAVY